MGHFENGSLQNWAITEIDQFEIVHSENKSFQKY